jgi:hypothetical protein
MKKTFDLTVETKLHSADAPAEKEFVSADLPLNISPRTRKDSLPKQHSFQHNRPAGKESEVP